MSRTSPPLVVVGAGCAGLSTVVALLDEGYDAPILVLEARPALPRDRTWCFWDTGEVPWSHLATAAWRRWTIGGVEQAAEQHPYLHLPSDVFSAAALRRLRRAAHVEVRFGVRVRAIRHGAPPTVVTDAGQVRAGHVIDARGVAHPAARAALRDGLTQRFRGQVVRTATPRFDAEVATVMDFTGDQADEVRFVYALPFSDREALVEDTSFSTAAVSAARRRSAIARWLDTPHEVLWEEHGVIPMVPVRPDERPGVTVVGVAGGAARPSSGYAFVRIQRQALAVADAVCRGRHVSGPAALAHRRRDALDAVFLRVARREPAVCAAAFTGLAAGVGGDVLARFMNDASSAADDLQVAAAMPAAPFLRAARAA